MVCSGVFAVLKGVCAENTAEKYGIGREEQDQYAIRSYKLSQKAAADGVFEKEIIPVEIPKKKGSIFQFRNLILISKTLSERQPRILKYVRPFTLLE